MSLSQKCNSICTKLFKGHIFSLTQREFSFFYTWRHIWLLVEIEIRTKLAMTWGEALLCFVVFFDKSCFVFLYKCVPSFRSSPVTHSWAVAEEETKTMSVKHVLLMRVCIMILSWDGSVPARSQNRFYKGAQNQFIGWMFRIKNCNIVLQYFYLAHSTGLQNKGNAVIIEENLKHFVELETSHIVLLSLNHFCHQTIVVASTKKHFIMYSQRNWR